MSARFSRLCCFSSPLHWQRRGGARPVAQPGRSSAALGPPAHERVPLQRSRANDPRRRWPAGTSRVFWPPGQRWNCCQTLFKTGGRASDGQWRLKITDEQGMPPEGRDQPLNLCTRRPWVRDRQGRKQRGIGTGAQTSLSAHIAPLVALTETASVALVDPLEQKYTRRQVRLDEKKRHAHLPRIQRFVQRLAARQCGTSRRLVRENSSA